MDNFDNFISSFCQNLVNLGTQPASFQIGNKNIQFPQATNQPGTPNYILRSKGVFPDGGIKLKDFLQLIFGSFPPPPPPLDTILGIELDAITVGFDKESGKIASGLILVAFPKETVIGVNKANISNLVCNLYVGLPGDPLMSMYASVSGDITLCGFPTTATISTDHHVTILLNKGNPIDVKPVLQELASMGGLDSLPFEAPTFEDAKLEFDLPLNNVRLSSNFQGASLSFLGITAKLNSFGTQITSPVSAWATVELDIGSVVVSGFFMIPGKIIITVTIPTLSPYDLVTKALPKVNCSVLQGIVFTNTEITFTKLTASQNKDLFNSIMPAGNLTLADAINAKGKLSKQATGDITSVGTASDSLMIKTTIDVNPHLPTGTDEFIKKLNAPVDLTKVDVSIMLTDTPSAQVRFALLSNPCDLIPKSDFKLKGFWLQANFLTENPSLALAVDISFPFKDQIFELYGSLDINAVEVKIAAQLMNPVVWKDALGIKSLDVSGLALELGWSFVDEMPTLGVTGKFSVSVPNTGSKFAGGVVFIIDGGNPGASVFGINFNHFDLCEAYHLFVPQQDASLDRLLREVSFDDCNFYVAPETTTIAKITFPEGMIIRGKFDLFGFKADVDVEVSPGGMKFQCDVETSIKIAGLLQISSVDGQKGPRLDFTTTPAKDEPYLLVDGLLSIANVLRVETKITFTKTNFSFDFKETFFNTANVMFHADADISSFQSGAFNVRFSITGLDELANRVTDSLRIAAKQASSDIDDAERKVQEAETSLKPIEDERNQRYAVLQQLITERDNVPWTEPWNKGYFEAQIVVVQSEVTSCDAAYQLAFGTLEAAIGVLNASKTVENVALNAIADFIANIPIKIHSVACSESLSAMGRSAFSATITLEVNNQPHSFSIEIDFNLKDIFTTLERDICNSIVNFFVK